jgi:endonuclease YncB( thermonuclease family)
MIRRIAAIKVFVLVLLLAGFGSAEEFSARVVWVHDGDSFAAQTDLGRVEVRLFGVDAPEGGQPFSRQALKFVMAEAKNRLVVVRAVDEDSYGRIVAWVSLPDGRLLNHVLVAEGLAWRYRRYAPDDVDLIRLESEARKNRRGLWSDPKPVPPWEYRRRK